MRQDLRERNFSPDLWNLSIESFERLVGDIDLSECSFAVPKEIETKFFVTRKALEESIDFSNLTHQRISQSFIPRSLLAEAVRVCKEHGFLASMPDELPFDVSYARVRRVKEEGERTFYFTIKGQKDKNYSRAEVEFEIPKKLYRDLLPLATDGTVKKDRYLLPGSTWDDSRHRTSLSKGAEIDIITHLGKGDQFRKLTNAETQFALIDVEFRSAKQRDQFHDGHHTLRILKRAGIELDPTSESGAKFLTMRYLARNGVDKAVLETIDSLEEMYNKSRTKLRKAA